MADSDAPAVATPDPVVDSPVVVEPSDSGQNSPAPQPQDGSNADARVRAAQAAFHAANQAAADLREENAQLKAQLAAGGTSESEELSPRERAAQRRIDELERERAETIYGSDALAALEIAERTTKRDPSVMGKLASYIAFAEARGAGSPAAPVPTAPTRAEAAAPRVDPNRADVPSGQLDVDIEEAKRKGDLGGFLKAALRPLTRSE